MWYCFESYVIVLWIEFILSTQLIFAFQSARTRKSFVALSMSSFVSSGNSKSYKRDPQYVQICNVKAILPNFFLSAPSNDAPGVRKRSMDIICQYYMIILYIDAIKTVIILVCQCRQIEHGTSEILYIFNCHSNYTLLCLITHLSGSYS